MSEQSEALMLADALESDYYDDVRVTAAAAELRRQHAEIEQLKAERDALLAEVEELDQLRNRMSELLTATAKALRGPPAPLSSHDWSSIPDRTADVVNALCVAMELAIKQRVECNALRTENERLKAVASRCLLNEETPGDCYAAEVVQLRAKNAALRAELREATESVDDPAVNNLRTLSEAIHMLRTERDALRADSERYRWLFCHDDKTARVNSVWRLWDGQSDWGAAIDATREMK
jgi:DNA repair exonuclease SbcCD ATPase subunit